MPGSGHPNGVIPYVQGADYLRDNVTRQGPLFAGGPRTWRNGGCLLGMVQGFPGSDGAQVCLSYVCGRCLWWCSTVFFYRFPSLFLYRRGPGVTGNRPYVILSSRRQVGPSVVVDIISLRPGVVMTRRVGHSGGYRDARPALLRRLQCCPVVSGSRRSFLLECRRGESRPVSSGRMAAGHQGKCTITRYLPSGGRSRGSIFGARGLRAPARPRHGRRRSSLRGRSPCHPTPDFLPLECDLLGTRGT